MRIRTSALSLSGEREDPILWNKITNNKEESNVFNDKEDIYIDKEKNKCKVSKDLIREIESLSKREFFADKDFTYSLYNEEGELRGLFLVLNIHIKVRKMPENISVALTII